MNDARLIYSIPEAASLLGISRSQAYSYTRTGELRTIRVGSRLGVPRSALGEMLDKSCGNGDQPDDSDLTTNQVIIAGRLTRDVEMRTTRSGLAVCTARLAARKRAGSEQALFIDVVAYGDRIDELANLRKGQAVKVIGRLDQRDWTSGDGTRRHAHRIVARTVERLEFDRDPVA